MFCFLLRLICNPQRVEIIDHYRSRGFSDSGILTDSEDDGGNENQFHDEDCIPTAQLVSSFSLPAQHNQTIDLSNVSGPDFSHSDIDEDSLTCRSPIQKSESRSEYADTLPNTPMPHLHLKEDLSETNNANNKESMHLRCFKSATQPSEKANHNNTLSSSNDTAATQDDKDISSPIIDTTRRSFIVRLTTAKSQDNFTTNIQQQGVLNNAQQQGVLNNAQQQGVLNKNNG